jgi:hypothetical protein
MAAIEASRRASPKRTGGGRKFPANFEGFATVGRRAFDAAIGHQALPKLDGFASTPRRSPRGNFVALVRSAPASSVALPLTHVTSSYSIHDTMGQEALLPWHCGIFGGDLVYLFYGRPAYRTAAERASNEVRPQ